MAHIHTTPDPVWSHVDHELERRRHHHQPLARWSELARVLHASSQTVHNWKVRGIPAKEYASIAAALGWSVAHLLSEDEAAPASSVPTSVQSTFQLSDRERALVEAFRDLPEDEQDDTYVRIVSRVRRLREYAERLLGGVRHNGREGSKHH